MNDVFDFFLMADELYRREQFGEAIKEFDRVLERKPGHFWAQYLNALCLLRQQRPAEARASLSACLAQRSDFVWLYLLRGFAHQELQAWAAAESDFARAAEMALDENARYVLFVNRGVLRVRTDRLGDAITDLKAAISLKPRAYQGYVNLAQAFRKQGKLEGRLRNWTARSSSSRALPISIACRRGFTWNAPNRILRWRALTGRSSASRQKAHFR